MPHLSSGTITYSPGSSECVEDPSLDPAKHKEPCPEGQMRVYHDRSSRCMPECKSGEYSRTGAVPCRNCPKGYVTDGSGATTCVKDSGSSSEEDKKKDCPKGTKYVTEDKYGSAAARVPPRLVQLHRPVSLHALQKWHVHQGESGATECTDYPTECPAGSKLITEGTTSKCARECAKGYFSATGVYPCKACKRGYTTTERGAVECVKSDKENNNNDNKDDKKECPEGTEWVEDDKAKGCRALCKLAGTTRTPVPGLAASAPVAQQLRLLALLSAWRTLAWTPPRKQKSVKRRNSRFLRQGLEVHARVQVRQVLSHWCRSLPQLPQGIRDRWLGATTCVKDSGSSSEEDKKKDCPKGTKYVTEDKYGSGCRPECRPGSYSSTGLYPCTRCKKVARTPRVVPLSALTILRSALQALS